MKTNHLLASSMKTVFSLAVAFTISLTLASCGDDDDKISIPANNVVIDGITKPIISAKINKNKLNKDNNYDIYLILSEERKEFIQIMASKNHHDGKVIDLTSKEGKHGGWYWSVEYYNNNEKIFDTYGEEISSYPVFISGTLYVKRLDDINGKPVVKIVLINGKVKGEGEYGDGKEHTIAINWESVLELLE